MSRKSEIAQEISIVMPKIARAITSSFTKADELPPTQIFAILALHEMGRCHFSDLCRALHVSAPTATGIIDRLEKKNYVKRIPDKNDRRATNIILTKQGLELSRQILKGIVKRWEMILESLPLGDCEQYLRIVKKIKDQMKERITKTGAKS